MNIIHIQSQLNFCFCHEKGGRKIQVCKYTASTSIQRQLGESRIPDLVLHSCMSEGSATWDIRRAFELWNG